MRDIEKIQAKDVNRKAEKKPFEKPKLEFVAPKLTKHGDATKITKGVPFMGSI